MSNASRRQQRSVGYTCEWPKCRRVYRRSTLGHRYCLDHADQAEREAALEDAWPTENGRNVGL